MLFGKHINKYYLKYSPSLLLGIFALIVIDYFQLIIPELYKLVVNGINDGAVEYKGATVAFDMDFLLWSNLRNNIRTNTNEHYPPFDFNTFECICYA